jgi:hypothetical protein
MAGYRWVVQGNMIVDCKQLVTTFLVEKVDVRRRLGKTGWKPARVSTSPEELMDEAKTAVNQRCRSLAISDRDGERQSTISTNDKSAYSTIQAQYFQKAIDTCVPKHDRLYQDVYEARLRQSFQAIGLDLDREPEPWADEDDEGDLPLHHEHVRAHVKKLRRMKEAYIRLCAEKVWRREYGEVIFLNVPNFPSKSVLYINPAPAPLKTNTDGSNKATDEVKGGLGNEERKGISLMSYLKRTKVKKVKR